MKITVEDIIGSTGLELKVDPGVPWVYAGFAGVLLTTRMQQCSAHCQGSLQEWLCINCMSCHARAVWKSDGDGPKYLAGQGKNLAADRHCCAARLRSS